MNNLQEYLDLSEMAYDAGGPSALLQEYTSYGFSSGHEIGLEEGISIGYDYGHGKGILAGATYTAAGVTLIWIVCSHFRKKYIETCPEKYNLSKSRYEAATQKLENDKLPQVDRKYWENERKKHLKKMNRYVKYL